MGIFSVVNFLHSIWNFPDFFFLKSFLLDDFRKLNAVLSVLYCILEVLLISLVLMKGLADSFMDAKFPKKGAWNLGFDFIPLHSLPTG